MNPQQELTVTRMVIGALRGLIESLQTQAEALEPRATAYQRIASDARSIRMIRDIAIANGFDPEWAEQRYLRHLNRGYLEQKAFDEVVAELEAG
jgi:hypothetical protein